MSRNKDPAVLFYPEAFLVGVQGLTMEERGQYITLLCLQQQQGHLSQKQIALSVGTASPDVLAKFEVDEEGLLYQHRMEEEIQRRRTFTESRRSNANKRYENKSATSASADTYADASASASAEHKQVHMRNRNINTNITLIEDIIDYLNTKLSTKYKSNAEYINKHINARLNEGFTYEDFVTVIDKKYAEWNGTEMAKFLRPETLFGTKFQGYLNELEGSRNGGSKEPYRSTELYGDYVG